MATPLYGQPLYGQPVASIADVDPRCTTRLDVAVDSATGSIALVVKGKRGGFKASIWISPEDFSELASLLAKGTE